MSRRRLAAALVACVLVAAACVAPSDDGTTCGRAKSALAQCGVMMPFDFGDSCTGTTQAISDCIVTAGGSCDALAEVARHLDRCATREAGASIPDDFPSVIAGDASRDARSDAKLPSFDGGPPNVVDASSDAPFDAPSGTVFDVSGTVASGEALVFKTERLDAGIYTFTFTVSGAVDVYVRKGFAVTATGWDCKTSSPTVACVSNIATSAVLHLLVRGQAATSSFHVIATEGSP